MSKIDSCPVCGAHEFAAVDVLWDGLIQSWQLAEAEVEYVNRQQGFYCVSCNNNLRMMALARALLVELGVNGTLREFSLSRPAVSVLEVNRAGNLTGELERVPGHRLVEYPEYDMQELSIPSASYDVVIHSDTLEHVPNPARGMSECRRVLKPGGVCIFTIPVIVDRLTRTRCGLAPSYHGQANVAANDQLVYTEFGADFWKVLVQAGFENCRMHWLEYPGGLAVAARS